MQVVTGPAEQRAQLMDSLAASGSVCWSLAERPGQIAWALLCGCGNPEPVLRAVLGDGDEYRAAVRKLLAWANRTALPRGRTPTGRHLKAVMDTLDEVKPGCLEAELLYRIGQAGKQLNAVELPARELSLELFLAAGAEHLTAGQMQSV